MSDLVKQIELLENLKKLNKTMEELKALSNEIEIKSRYVDLTLNDVLSIVEKQQEVIQLYHERFNLEV